jgi:hypothetical protein
MEDGLAVVEECSCYQRKTLVLTIFVTHRLNKTIQATWENAFKTCCSMGMSLLSVEYDDKNACFGNLASSNGFIVSIF